MTEILEAICSRMIAGALRAAQADIVADESAPVGGDKIKTRHLQRGLRGDPDLLALVAGTAALAGVANHFLDRTTGAALSPAQLLGFAAAAPDEEGGGGDEALLIRSHDVAAVDWTHHGDDAIVDKDFALLLKRQHPVFILVHESAVRALLARVASAALRCAAAVLVAAVTGAAAQLALVPLHHCRLTPHSSRARRCSWGRSRASCWPSSRGESGCASATPGLQHETMMRQLVAVLVVAVARRCLPRLRRAP